MISLPKKSLQPRTPVKEGGSKTYSKLLSGMIDSDKKIILGRDRTYTAGEKEEAIDGDGSYGQIEGELNLDWIYERQEEMKAASGSIFNFAKKSSSKKKNTVKGIGITTAKKNIV